MTEKKAIFVLNIGDYWPELCAYSLPTIRRYAERIGARYHEIRERRYPEFPITYEKVQIHELGRGNDWNILVDADILIHPRMHDVTKMFAPVGVASNYNYPANRDQAVDAYFVRDGRNIGISDNFVVVPASCHDLWTPLEFGWEETRKRIRRDWIAAEYCFSRNLARFGLKHTGIFADETKRYMIHHVAAEDVPADQRASRVDAVRKLVKAWESELTT